MYVSTSNAHIEYHGSPVNKKLVDTCISPNNRAECERTAWLGG